MEKTPDAKLKAQILMAGMSRLEGGGVFKEHTHPYYQLTHMVKGSFRYTIEEQGFDVNEGDTVLVPLNLAHSITNTGEGAGYYFEVKFFSFSKGLTELCAEVDHIIHGDDFSALLLKEIFDESNNQTAGSEEIMCTYLYAIILKLSANKRREKSTPSKYIDISSYSPAVRDVIRFMEENYMRQLTLDEIVAQTSLKKSHLCNLFKKETTITIFECLMIIRVRRAVELLSYTELPLAQISRETGFINTTHFNRVYTKHVMIPPGQFRKHLNSQDQYWRDAILKNNISPITAATFENRKIDVQSIQPG